MLSSVTDPASAGRLVEKALPQRRVAGVQQLSGGLINTNLKVTFSTGEAPVVLRLHQKGPASCLKETNVLQLVGRTVPVPDVLYVEPNGIDNSGPYSILQFVEGLTFQQLKRTRNLPAIHQASASVGKTLAAIGRYKFAKPGSLIGTPANEVEVGPPYTHTSDPIPEILDTFLSSAEVQRRLGPFAKRVHAFVWEWAPSLPDITDVSDLVHSDFGNRNIVVNEVDGQWEVAAILDWEFAFSGSPLLDVGNFLRYECGSDPLREPYFSQSFVAHGGRLPDNWRKIIGVMDLTALVECLNHDYLPNDVLVEILDLILSTVDECQI